MSKDQVKFSNGMLTLTAKKVTGQPDAVHGGQNIKIHYLAGAIHAKEHFNVSRGGGYDFSGEFKATTTKGTWPAFWLTAVDGWPPEIDMAEWKGSSDWQSFNTFNTSSVLSWKDVTYPTPDQFHSIKCEVRDINQKEYVIVAILTSPYPQEPLRGRISLLGQQRLRHHDEVNAFSTF